LRQINDVAPFAYQSYSIAKPELFDPP